MTQPNLDALAKLGPFFDHDGWIAAADLSAPDPVDIAAALNEWAELRNDLWSPHAAVVQENADLRASAANRAREVSALRDELHAMGVRLGVEQSKGDELRAYRERTEAALVNLSRDYAGDIGRLQSTEMRRLIEADIETLKRHGLWRDPAPKGGERWQLN